MPRSVVTLSGDAITVINAYPGRGRSRCRAPKRGEWSTSQSEGRKQKAKYHMSIPPFNEHGLLPAGIHDCTMQEAAARFGTFQGSERRPLLWSKFKQFFREVAASRLVEALVLDGSFVTAKPEPNDIDIVVVLFAIHDWGADLPPYQYNVLAEQSVRRRFGFDIVAVKNGTEDLDWATEFFAQVRQQPALKKGLLRIRL